MADGVLKTTISTFKTQATYTRVANGATTAVAGVFDNAHQSVDPQTGAQVTSTQPTFGIRLADLLAAPDSGDTVTIGATVYRVIDTQPDGQGGSTLILHRNG